MSRSKIVKNALNVPLVGNPDQLGIGAPAAGPNIATDHSLPFRRTVTEALGVTVIALCLVLAVMLKLDVHSLATWLWGGLLLVAGFAIVLLLRYEDHVRYIRANRRPEALDLDADGQPDRMYAVWFNQGAPAARPGTLAATYSRHFAEFIAAGQRVGTTTRALRSEGFDDTQQALFRNWLLQRQAANLLPHGRWELGDEAALQRVLRCTGWATES